jgi:hypothetical protein
MPSPPRFPLQPEPDAAARCEGVAISIRFTIAPDSYQGKHDGGTRMWREIPAKAMVLEDVALLPGFGRDYVKDILERGLARRLAKPNLNHARYLAVEDCCM